MTEEQKKSANAEIWSTLRWFSNESTRIYERLNKEQGAERKLDGGNEPYKELHAEFARRMKAIGEKYDLPHNEESS